MKKTISTAFLSIFLIFSCAIPAFADSGQSVWFKYRNYSIPGSVDGSKNGEFYTLTSGGVSLDVSSTTASGDMNVSLRLSQFGFDKECGENTIDGTGTYTWTINTNSSKYYLFAYGGANDTTQTLSGTMHDHR